MAALTLKSLLSPKAGALPAVAALAEAMGGYVGIDGRVRTTAGGRALRGAFPRPGYPRRRHPGLGDRTTRRCRCHRGSLLTHLAAKESERRALAGEVLHLYREVHLIEHLSEQLTALLDLSAVGQSALDQARRLIAASHGGILVMEEPGGPLRS